MLIYKVGEADAGERWHPTQAKAQACAKAYGGTVQQAAVGEDGRDGMCAILNEAELTIHERHDAPEAEERPAIPLGVPSATDPDLMERFARNREADEIVEFILERAAVHQVENIMQALGARVGELAKQNRKG